MEGLMRKIHEAGRDIPVMAETDVLVVGSGPAGIAAAVAAARTGAKTLLAERYGCFGGALSIGQVESYNWYFTPHTYYAYGLSSEIEQRMIEMKGTQPDSRGIGHFFNAEIYKLMLDRWIEEESITPLLHSLAVGTVKEGNEVRGVIFESKSGRAAVMAKCVVDATGDGDVASLAGAGYHIGNKEPYDVLPVTMVFGVGGVDVEMFTRYVEAHKEMTEPETHGLKKVFKMAQQAGKWPYSREGGAWKTLTPSGDFTSLNITREFGVNGVDVWDLTRAEISGRRQAMEAIEAMREFGSEMGLAHCYLRSFAFQIGIRETRRINCEYNVTRRDVMENGRFSDSIGVFTRFIDGEVISRDDSHFELPYRMIVPVGIDNLLVSGRCAGCESDAVQTVRMMVCCTATGQAAGTAAALAAMKGMHPREIGVERIQAELVKNNVRLS